MMKTNLLKAHSRYFSPSSSASFGWVICLPGSTEGRKAGSQREWLRRRHCLAPVHMRLMHLEAMASPSTMLLDKRTDGKTLATRQQTNPEPKEHRDQGTRTLRRRRMGPTMRREDVKLKSVQITKLEKSWSYTGGGRRVPSQLNAKWSRSRNQNRVLH